MFFYQLYPWFKFYFPVFLCMVIYDNEYKQEHMTSYAPGIKQLKEIINRTKNKIETQHTPISNKVASVICVILVPYTAKHHVCYK